MHKGEDIQLKRKEKMKENQRKLQVRKRGNGNRIKLNIVEEENSTILTCIEEELKKNSGKN